VSFFLALGCASGCQALFGVDDDQGPESDGGSGPAGVGGGGGGAVQSGAGAAAGGPVGCTCVDPAPEGWEGYFEVTSREADAAVTVCNAGAAIVLFEGPADTTCAPCQCGPAMGAACSAPSITCYNDNACTAGGFDYTNLLAGGDCAATLMPGSRWCELSGPPQLATSSGCTASGGGLAHVAPWASADDLCTTPTGAGCSAAEVCVQPGACIKKAGSTQCPPGWPTKRSAYTGGPDTRGCSECACASAEGVQCAGGSYTFFYYLADCGAEVFGTPVSTAACTSVGQPLQARAYAPAPNVAGASCPPTGGAPTGTLDLGQDVTVCCR